MNTIDLKIKKVLKEKDWTAKKLIGKIGFTESGFAYAMKNKSLKIKDLEKIAEVLEVPVSYFFGEENELKKINGEYNQVNINSNHNSSKISNNSQSELKKEIRYLKDKCAMLEGKVQDKQDLIELLKNK